MDWKLTISRGWAKERIPTLITSFGVLFAVLYVVELFVYYSGFDVLSDDFPIGLFVSGIFFLALVYGGRWLARSDLSPDRYPRVVKWVLSGMGLYLAINLPMIVFWSMGGVAGKISWGDGLRASGRRAACWSAPSRRARFNANSRPSEP